MTKILILLGFVSVFSGKWFVTLQEKVVALKCQEPVTWWCSVMSYNGCLMYCEWVVYKKPDNPADSVGSTFKWTLYYHVWDTQADCLNMYTVLSVRLPIWICHLHFPLVSVKVTDRLCRLYLTQVYSWNLVLI